MIIFTSYVFKIKIICTQAYIDTCLTIMFVETVTRYQYLLCIPQLVSQNFPYLLNPLSYCHSQLCPPPYLFANQISKESINICRILSKYKSDSFYAKTASMRTSCVLQNIKYSTKFLYASRGSETCKKLKLHVNCLI